GNEQGFAKVFAYEPKLYWMGCGKADGVMANTKRLKEWFDFQGFPSTLYESEGGHIWRNWREYLTIFAQKLFKDTPKKQKAVRMSSSRSTDMDD
ncbi:MAG: hypothetical protein IK074_04435, partial [Bacteroidales bacterium]|nr:hypothetical protein [Bacteroidales bacterium]